MYEALRAWAYHEATETARVSVPVRQRECQIADYDSRRTGNWFSDRGSIPLSSTRKTAYLRGLFFFILHISEEMREKL